MTSYMQTDWTLKEEMNKVLEIYTLSELSQEETDNLIKLITGSKSYL